MYILGKVVEQGSQPKKDMDLNVSPASKHSKGIQHAPHPMKHGWSMHTPSEQSASAVRWAGPRA